MTHPKTCFYLTRRLSHLFVLLLYLNTKLSPPKPESKLEVPPQPQESHTALFLCAKDISLVQSPRDPLEPPTLHNRTKLALRLNSSASTLSWLCSLLILAGDLETNPGPPNYKYPCSDCKKPCKSNQASVMCDTCQKWTHQKCAKIPSHIFKTLSNPDISWHCSNCKNTPSPATILESPLPKLNPLPPLQITFDQRRRQHQSLPRPHPTLREHNHTEAKLNQTSRAW